MQHNERDEPSPDSESFADARREFLAKCGRLAVVTPPTVTLLLAASKRNFAVAYSGGGSPRGNDGDEDHDRNRKSRHRRHANDGFGNGGRDRVPGRSHHPDGIR